MGMIIRVLYAQFACPGCSKKMAGYGVIADMLRKYRNALGDHFEVY